MNIKEIYDAVESLEETFEEHIASIRDMLHDLERSESCNGCRTFRLSFAEAIEEHKAGHRFAVGDVIVNHHDEVGDIAWNVIGVDVDGKDTITLHMRHVMEEYRAFDAPTKQYRWGHNEWATSSIREWLNVQFLDGFSSEDQRAMRPVKKTTHKNNEEGGQPIITEDKLFLLSASEIGFSGSSIADDGTAYPFFKDDESRQKTDAESGDDSWYWLRSPLPSNAGGVRLVHPDGSLSYSIASYGYGAAAACVIG